MWLLDVWLKACPIVQNDLMYKGINQKVTKNDGCQLKSELKSWGEGVSAKNGLKVIGEESQPAGRCYLRNREKYTTTFLKI